jgi:hypothetical protein
MRRLERLISKFERMEEGPAKERLRPLFGSRRASVAYGWRWAKFYELVARGMRKKLIH